MLTIRNDSLNYLELNVLFKYETFIIDTSRKSEKSDIEWQQEIHVLQFFIDM